jgi:TonB family protein
MRSFAVTLALTVALVPSAVTAQERRCSDTKTPKRLPAASALLDSAGALAELAGFETAPDGMVFSLHFPEDDSLPRILPILVVNDQAAAVLSRFIRPQKPADFWGVRVRVVSGASPALSVERSIYCPPVPTDQSYTPFQARIEVRPGDRMPKTSRPIRVVVEVMVAENGEAVRAKVVQSSGLKELDDELARHWEVRRFLPALLDGVPIPWWFRTDGKAPRL